MKGLGRTVVVLVVGAVLVAFFVHRHEHGSTSAKATTSATSLSLRHIGRIPWTTQDPARSSTPQSIAVMSGSPPAAPDWRSRFASSHDYFAFVKRAALAASHGDGTAALYVSRALDVCQLQIALYGGSSDPQANFQTWLSEQTHMSESQAAVLQEHFDVCKRFFHSNAFAKLPPKAGGYLLASYWREMAYKDGNPVAQVFHVVSDVSVIGGKTKSRRSQLIAQAQKTLVSAVSTGDPEALFRTGTFLADGHAANEVRAFAIAIAGCNLGYDCSADSLGGCAETGQCINFSDVVTKALGPSGYAKAYAMAQQLQEAISRGDKATITRFIQLQQGP